MSDLIRKRDAVSAISDLLMIRLQGKTLPTWNEVYQAIESITSAEPELGIIRCADCKWWDRLEDDHPYGNCRACRSGTHTERWNIHIQRQCKYDFYCADAEPKEEDDDES